jgi:hypothetical protein
MTQTSADAFAPSSAGSPLALRGRRIVRRASTTLFS